jgi:hypothetical protein
MTSAFLNSGRLLLDLWQGDEDCSIFFDGCTRAAALRIHCLAHMPNLKHLVCLLHLEQLLKMDELVKGRVTWPSFRASKILPVSLLL